MNPDQMRRLLTDVRNGDLPVEDALQHLRQLPYESLDGFARLDLHRSLRTGFPEVIFGQGKTADQLLQIFNRLAEQNDRVLATRVDAAVYAQIRAGLPADAVYSPTARTLHVLRADPATAQPGVLVLTGGTTDLPVAEEAAITAEVMGSAVTRIYDVGVAGLHRLLDQLPALHKARVIVAVAGMEGALPSVVAGLVSVPVIAVPTSVGYGASFEGLAALLAMLNSCAAGVGVVNIDNGFGAGYLAGVINRNAHA